MRHSYSFENKKLNPIRLTILAIAVLADLVCIFMIPSAIFKPIIFLWIGLVFLGFLGLRISTIYMTYSIEYSYYKGVLSVNKTYYRKSYTIISIDKSSIQSIEKYNLEDVNAIEVYYATCVYDRYLLTTTSGDKYILSLDDTMYAALTTEDKYDLFR